MKLSNGPGEAASTLARMAASSASVSRSSPTVAGYDFPSAGTHGAAQAPPGAKRWPEAPRASSGSPFRLSLRRGVAIPVLDRKGTTAPSWCRCASRAAGQDPGRSRPVARKLTLRGSVLVLGPNGLEGLREMPTDAAEPTSGAATPT